jgi:hypothetical protein
MRLTLSVTKFCRFGELPLAQARPTFLLEEVAEPVDFETAELDVDEGLALLDFAEDFAVVAALVVAALEVAGVVVTGSVVFGEEGEVAAGAEEEDLTLQRLPLTDEVESARLAFAIIPWWETSR